MSFVVRGAKNAFRNGLRTVALVVILALSLGLALTMLLSRQAIEAKIAGVKHSIGNTITVTPAGARGFSGGGTPLTQAQVDQVKTIPHVASVTSSLTDQLASTDTSLTSAIEAGSLGRRRRLAEGEGANGLGGSFTPPVSAIASSDVTNLAALGGNNVTITSGKTFDAASNDNVALVGSTLATKNNLSVGSTFTAYGTPVTVVAIFSSGNDRFGGNTVVFPLATLQRLSSQPASYTQMTVLADSIDNVSAVSSAITAKLGDAADVTSSQSTAEEALAPLQNIAQIALYSLIGAIVSGAVIIFLTMLMVVRGRRREIGVYKAIGASNLKIVTQFISEAMVLTFLGAIVGAIVGAVFSGSVARTLATSAVSSTATAAGPGMGRFGGGGFGRGFGRALGGGIQSLTNIHTSVGWGVLLYGLAGAVVIALVGSAIPAYAIAKIRPAEVMRGE